MDSTTKLALSVVIGQLGRIQDGIAPLSRFCDLAQVRLANIRDGKLLDDEALDEITEVAEALRTVSFEEISEAMALAIKVIDRAGASGGLR